MTLTTQRGHQLFIAATILAVTGFRLIIAAQLPLSFDEAYYWCWSQELSLSYPDHPPLVAWLIRLGTAIVGSNELGVRLVFVLLSGIGMVLIYSTARALDLSRPKAALAMLTAALLPAVAVGSLLATPDLPLGICFLGTVFLLIKMPRKEASAWRTVLLAIVLALALYAKLAAVLLALTVGAVVATVPPVRKYLVSRTSPSPEGRGIVPPETGSGRPGVFSGGRGLPRRGTSIWPWWLEPRSPGGEHPRPGAVWLPKTTKFRANAIAVLALALLTTPYLLADLHSNRGATLFQLQRLDPSSLTIQRTLTHLGEIAGGQLGLITPVIAFLALAAWWVRPRRAETTILSLAWWIPIGATCCAAVFTHPEQNWAALGHPFSAILAVWLLATDEPLNLNRADIISRHRKKLLAATLAGVLLPAILIHIHALTPILPLPPKKDPIGKLHGFDVFAKLPQWIPPNTPVQGIFVDNYGLASQVAWTLRDQTYPVGSCDRPSWGPLTEGTWLLLDEVGDLSHRRLPQSCRSTRPLRIVKMRDPAGRVLGNVQVNLGFGCKYGCGR